MSRELTTVIDFNWRISDIRRVVDGDTFDLTIYRRIDSGFYDIEDKFKTMRFRLYNIDIVEINEAGGTPATRFAEDWLRAAYLDGVLWGYTHKSDALTPPGAFGRWLIDLYRADTGEHLADALRAAGYEKA